MEQRTRDKLTAIKDSLLPVALEVGCMHSNWDDIFEINAHLNGDNTFLNIGPEEYLNQLEKRRE